MKNTNINTNTNKILFSIIIPVQRLNDYVKETCGKLKELDSNNFEVIILPDEIGDNKNEGRGLNAEIIPTGKTSPAKKRDIGAKRAKGHYLAFIDDDAYPEKDWLKIAEKHLTEKNVSAVGGPQLTPADDNFWQKVSGAMYLSPLSGGAIIRFLPGKKIKEIDDWPTVNFIIKKNDFKQLGGFNTKYWPGEDTKLCLDIIKKLNKRILYIPDLKVYHHRRSGLIRHQRQIGRYGLHRGYFAKVFPETSMKISRLYFMPSLFVLFLVFGLIGSFFSSIVLKIFLSGIIIYLGALFISTLIIWIRVKNILISLASVPYLISFHIWYGIRFIQGFLFTKELRSRLRSE